jgi:hypothetical protein
MSRGDGTGPAGMGPMTGRAAGYCAGYNMPGFMNPYGGWGGAGAPFADPSQWIAGAEPVPRYGPVSYPAYGAFRPRGRRFGSGFGRGPGRGRGWR